MVSLTTVYILSVILTSIAGVGSAFAGNKMIGGSVPVYVPPPIDESQFTAPPSEEFPPSSTEQT